MQFGCDELGKEIHAELMCGILVEISHLEDLE